jgi:ATP-dependent DNA ligase
MQAKRGPVQFDAWDIVKLRGKDVSHLPAVRRRELLEDVINEVRRYNRNWSVVERYAGDDPVAFYNSVIQDPRGLPYAEGIVVESAGSPAGTGYYKFKNRDFEDFVVVDILPSKGIKYADSAAVLVVRDPVTGAIGEVGSFTVPDAQRQWIWNHREELKGAVAKVSVMEKTEAGMPRAGVFHGWHGDPRYGGIGTEMSLAMYSEALAGGDPEEAQRMLYRMKSSQGWRKAA